MHYGPGFVIVLVFFSAAVPADVIRVPADQPTIQDGITAASNGDTVLVAPGEYTENIDFNGKPIIVVSEFGPGATRINGGQQGSVVTFDEGEGSTAQIRGFTITNGSGNPGYLGQLFGGGICCEGASPSITGNLITGNPAEQGGGISCFGGASPKISANTIISNSSGNAGGIRVMEDCAPHIVGNRICDNEIYQLGGGIAASDSRPVIEGNIITGNTARTAGGIFLINCDEATIDNNLIAGNSCQFSGGGIGMDASSPTISGNTIFDNRALTGGGVYCNFLSYPEIVDSILWNNHAQYGPEAYVMGGEEFHCTLTIEYSDVEGGKASIIVETGSTLIWGEGMIDADPLFVSGPHSASYLSQLAAGQPSASPCVDSGDPQSQMTGSTRTDGVADQDVVDMGYHCPLETGFRLIAGPGPAEANPAVVGVVAAEASAPYVFQFRAYGSPRFGTNVTCGDVTGEMTDEIITGAGPGPGFGPHVRGFRVDGHQLPGLSFLAYGTNRWGVQVAAGDLDGDGFDEIITGAGPGAGFGPHVRGWNWDGAGPVVAMGGVNFFAYGTPKWGVNVAAGDIDGDDSDEIVTGAGPGSIYGPHVRGWNVDGGSATPIHECSFLAYGTRKYGVRVGCGDVDGDGIDEIVTAPGPSPEFAAHVRGFEPDGTPVPGLSFFAWAPPEARFGATVFAGADLDGDGRDELVVGQGPDPSAATPVKVYRYQDSLLIEWLAVDAFPDLTHGTNVAAGRF